MMKKEDKEVNTLSQIYEYFFQGENKTKYTCYTWGGCVRGLVMLMKQH